MRLCPYCRQEASTTHAGDESIDVCHECDVVVEGNTLNDEEDENE